MSLGHLLSQAPDLPVTEQPCAAAEHCQSLPPAPAATDSHQSGTGSFSLQAASARRGSFFPAQTTRISQAGTIIHGAHHNGKQIKKLTWDLFVALFVLLVFSFVFFPSQVYFESTLRSLIQNSANMTEGEADTSITAEQQSCPREVVARVELKTLSHLGL